MTAEGVEPSMHDLVQLQIADGVATLTLNRPDSLNSMNNPLMDGIRLGLEAAVDQGARVIVLTGAGRGFCSGADLSVIGPTDDEPAAAGDEPPSVTDGMDQHFNKAMRALKDCPVPTVARVNGAAAGGGLGLALACDIAVAGRSAFFVATFGPRLGIVPDLGTTWSLPGRVGRARAMAMSMLGERITADQAEDWGLIYKTVDDDQLDNEIERITNILRRTSATAMQRIRTSLDTASTRSFSDQLDLERDHQAVLIPMNMAEGAAAFLEKRDPDFG